MSDDELEQTVWQKVRHPRRRYEGEDKRAPEPITIGTLIPYAALLGTIVSGVAGYVTLTNDVKYMAKEQVRLQEQHDRDMEDYLGWNKGISERLRELERQ
jgi:hypothetical protein